MSTTPPGRVYRIALSIRLRTSRERSRAAPRTVAGVGRFDREANARLAGLVLVPLGLLSHEGVEAHPLAQLAAGFEPGEVEQVGDDP